MIYQKREVLNKSLDDEYFFNTASTGVYLFKYNYDINNDLFFKNRMYDKIRVEVSKNKYFVLENIYNDKMLLQRITFMHTDVSYNRTACATEDVTDVGLPVTYTNGSYKFTDWKLDNLNENDIEVKKILKSSSKASVDERLVGKNDDIFDLMFRYKGRVNVASLPLTKKAGFYSLLDEVSEFKKIFQVKDDFYKRRSNNRLDVPKNKDYYNTKNETMLQGVLEVYRSDKYIFQSLYISNPFITNLNRALNINDNQWTEWRINQTVDDTYWLQNVNPNSTYTELPIVKRNLYLNSTSILYKLRGYSLDDDLRNPLINYAYNKANSYREKYNEFYKLEGINAIDFIYGYSSPLSPNLSELGPGLDPINMYNNSQFESNMPRNNVNWGTSYTIINYNGDNNQDEIKQASTLGTGKLAKYGKNVTLDAINGKFVRESFRFINGLSIYWTTDKLYFDVLQNIVVDTNVNNEKL